MLATIDEETARKVDRDRRVLGCAYLRVGPDGRIEHVVAPGAQPEGEREVVLGDERRMFE